MRIASLCSLDKNQYKMRLRLFHLYNSHCKCFCRRSLISITVLDDKIIYDYVSIFSFTASIVILDRV